MHKKYLTNYYYVHPKRKAIGTQPPQPARTTKARVEEVAIQSEAVQEKTQIKQVLGVKSKEVQTVQEIAIQTHQEPFTGGKPAASIQTQTEPPNEPFSPGTMQFPRPRPPLQDSSAILLSLLCELACCLWALQSHKKSVGALNISPSSIFEYLGSEGWNWLSFEQFLGGVRKLQIECQDYQVDLLFRRVVGQADMMEFQHFVQKVLRPLMAVARELGGSSNPMIIGDRLKALRDLFCAALEVEYYCYLIKQLMVSQGWTEQSLIQLLRGDKLELAAQSIDLKCLERCLRGCPRQSCQALFAYSCDPEASVITSASLQSFLLN